MDVVDSTKFFLISSIPASKYNLAYLVLLPCARNYFDCRIFAQNMFTCMREAGLLTPHYALLIRYTGFRLRHPGWGVSMQLYFKIKNYFMNPWEEIKNLNFCWVAYSGLTWPQSDFWNQIRMFTFARHNHNISCSWYLLIKEIIEICIKTHLRNLAWIRKLGSCPIKGPRRREIWTVMWM